MSNATKKRIITTLDPPEYKMVSNFRDFFTLSLVVSTGLLIFTIFAYLILKISSYFSGGSSSSSFKSPDFDQESSFEELDGLEDVGEKKEEGTEKGEDEKKDDAEV
jgi:hypothetical protein